MKLKLVFTVLAGLMICSIFSTSLGAERFYYGTWGTFDHSFSEVKDSLRFNIIAGDVDSSTVDSFRVHSLRAIVGNWDENSPNKWATLSHYTLWETEGLLGSWVNLRYNGGSLVNDPYASGGEAMSFSGSDTGLIQWGPRYYQETGDTLHPIQYTAEFRLKYLNYSPRGPMASGPPTPLCRLMVLDHNTVLMERLIYKTDFPMAGVYDTFQLANYTVPDTNKIEFRIYRLNRPEPLYVDYVKVYDDGGKNLMNGIWDSAIIAYVDSPWVHTTIPGTGDTVVYRWYMRDQPHSVDCFTPYVYIDSLLKQVSAERVGVQAFKRILKPRKSLMPNQNKDFSPRWMLPSALIP
jgi:hypothetical protein